MYRKKVITIFIVILGAIGALAWWFGRLSDLYLAGQQDALRDEWIESNAGTETKYAYLTFDDGPSENTDAILDILKEENVKATFFVVGKEGNLSKQRYLRIVKEGHTLGMHSYTHDYDQIYRSVDDFAADIQKLDRFLYGITGMHPTAFRFPGGSSNSIVSDIKPYIKWVQEQGYEYYDWNAVSGDAISFNVSAETLNQNILKDVNGQKSVIILMHDLAEATHTVDALPALITELRERGYTLCKITEKTEAIHHISSQ
jgi:peptidoglycan/xylan/chitin deacetylase (PgdA/CDA1 family)